MNIHFLIPEDINLLKGNYVYNKRIAEGLKAIGHQVIIQQLPDDFPFPSDTSLQQCRQIMGAIPQAEPVIIDNLVFGVIPDILKDFYLQKPIVALVHITLSADPNLTAYQREMVLSLEKKAQKYAKKFIVSSSYTANLLTAAGIEKNQINVIIPGVDNYPQKKIYPGKPSKLLSIANFTRNKGYMTLMKALTALKNKDWELHCYGNLNFDKEYVDELQMIIRRNGLKEKVWLHGPVSGKELSDVYLNADLFIHASNFETYGMAVAEALAHGIPVITSTGGGICETVPVKMGQFFNPGDVYVLQTIIEELLENPQLYKTLYTEASTYHNQVHTWQKSLESFELTLKEVTSL